MKYWLTFVARFFAIMALVLVGVGEVQAVPVDGTVNLLNYNGGTSGTALYTFTNVPGGSNAPFVGLSLTFDGSLFNLGATSVNSLSVSNGWYLGSVNVAAGQTTYELAMLGGIVPSGQALSFTANYSLLGTNLTNSFSQLFTVAYLGSPWLGGGSTTLTPEPGSLILLGSGLAGLGMWRRKQQAKA